jgi:hypothetical protein
MHLTIKMHYNTRVLSDSIKFYLPRTEGYLEIIREPTKYMLVAYLVLYSKCRPAVVMVLWLWYYGYGISSVILPG